MQLVKISIGIDVEVKICTDLDSNGVALLLLNNDNGLGRFCFNLRKGFDNDFEFESSGRYTQFILGKKIARTDC